MMGGSSKKSAGREVWNVRDMENQMEEIKDYARQAKLMAEYYNSESGLKDLTKTLKDMKDERGQRKFTDDRVNELVKSIQEGYDNTFKGVNEKIINERNISGKEIEKYLKKIENIKQVSNTLKKAGGVSIQASSILGKFGGNMSSPILSSAERLKSSQDAKKFVESIGNTIKDSDTQRIARTFLQNYDETKNDDDTYRVEQRKVLKELSNHLVRIGEDKDFSIGEKGTGGLASIIPKISGDMKKVTENLKKMQSSMILLGAVGAMVNRIGGTDYSNFSAVIKGWTGKSIGDWTKTMITKLTAEKKEAKKDKDKHSSKVGKGLDFLKNGVTKVISLLKLQALANMILSVLKLFADLVMSPVTWALAAITAAIEGFNSIMQIGWDNTLRKIDNFLLKILEAIAKKILPKSIGNWLENYNNEEEAAQKRTEQIEKVIKRYRTVGNPALGGADGTTPEIENKMSEAFLRENPDAPYFSRGTPEYLNMEAIGQELISSGFRDPKKAIQEFKDRQHYSGFMLPTGIQGGVQMYEIIRDLFNSKSEKNYDEWEKEYKRTHSDQSFLQVPQTQHNYYSFNQFPSLPFAQEAGA